MSYTVVPSTGSLCRSGPCRPRLHNPCSGTAAPALNRRERSCVPSGSWRCTVRASSKKDGKGDNLSQEEMLKNLEQRERTWLEANHSVGTIDTPVDDVLEIPNLWHKVKPT